MNFSVLWSSSITLALGIVLISTASPGSSEIDLYYAPCHEQWKIANLTECCDKPLLLPPIVTRLCSRKQMPPVPENVTPPAESVCQAECALNETRILTDMQFSLRRAITILTSRITPNSPWMTVVTDAVVNCYRHTYATVLGDSSGNSSELNRCSPLGSVFLDCVLSYSYRKCPDDAWKGGENCNSLSFVLNSCSYIFVESNVY